MKFLPQLHYGLVVFANKCRLFCTCAHAAYISFIYFRFGQLIRFPVWGQLCCGCQGEESKTCFSGNILYTLSKVVFHQKSSCVKSRLPSGVIFRQRSSFVKGRLLLKVVFRQRSSSVKSRLPSKVVFHRRSSSSFGSFSFLGFSPECGIAKLSLSLFVSSCWST